MSDLEKPDDIEKESLPAHVAMCTLRYAEIKRRMLRVEIAVYVVLAAVLLGPKEAFEVARKALAAAL